MSNIMTALREMELEQRDSTALSRARLVASAPAADDFSVLKEFTAPQAQQAEIREQQPFAHQPQPSQEALILFADDYSALEERIVRVVETVKCERRARLAAEERAVNAEEQMSWQALRIEDLEQQIGNRDNITDERSQSIVRMVNLLDSLELSCGD